MKGPLVSVIMPTYNDGKYLKPAIESILNQTYPNIELLLINDGCTDNTDAFVKTLVDFRLKYFVNDKNRGYIFSLNKGISLAKGKYIARMDADDLCPLDRLEKQISYLENNPQIDVIGGSMITFENNTNKERICNFPENHDEIKSRLFFRNAISHPTIVIKTKILTKYNIKYNSEYIAAEDYKLWTDLIKVARFHNLSDNLLYYRIHSNSVSKKRSQIQLETANKIQKEILTEFIPNLNDTEISFHLQTLNERYNSKLDIRKLSHWYRHLEKLNKESKTYASSAFKKEINNLILDHILNKKKYTIKEITFLYYRPQFFVFHSLISVKFIVKCFLRYSTIK